MKKLFIFLSIIVVLFGGLFVLNQQSNKAKFSEYENNPYGKAPQDLSPATLPLINDPNYQDIILPDELQAKINNKESFFAYFFASSCKFCKETTPVLSPLASDMGVVLHKFNLEEFPHHSIYKVEYTPTLVYYKDGVETERIEGGITATAQGNTIETFKAFLEKYKG